MATPQLESGGEPAERMSFMSHLRELRRRLGWAMLGVFIAAIGCLFFSAELFDWLRGPMAHLPSNKLIVLSPLELYVTYIKLAVVAALFVSSPWILYQLWRFVAPGLYGHERRWIAPFIILGTMFFVGGAAFAFYIVLPIGFRYLVEMMPETIEAQYSVAVYYSLVTNLMIAFGAVFELPLVMWILSAARIVDPKVYKKLRRYWIVVAFIVAAILTPPDPFTQILMAVPLLFFFEIGVLGAKMLYRKRVPS